MLITLTRTHAKPTTRGVDLSPPQRLRRDQSALVTLCLRGPPAPTLTHGYATAIAHRTDTKIRLEEKNLFDLDPLWGKSLEALFSK